MSNHGRARFADKHPSGAEADATVSTILRDRCADGRLPCRLANDIAMELDVDPSLVGMSADLLELKLVECQLGLFGWSGGDGSAGARASEGNDLVDLDRLIREQLIGGSLTCTAAWAIADRAGVDRAEVGSACDETGVKVVGCQLGAF